jgi:hypothetical protein
MSNLKQIKVNVKQEDYELIKQNAMRSNISLAEFIRQQLKISIDLKSSRNPVGYFRKRDPQLLYELNQISKALNQIATAIESNIEINSFLLLQIYTKVMRLK